MRAPRFLTILVVSLFAVPLFAANVSKARCISLEHAHGAWRMQIDCEGSTGAISMIDVADHVSFRGEGMFATWTQEQLRAEYMLLLPHDDVVFEPLLLG